MAKVVKEAGKDTDDQRQLKLHGSGNKRVYFQSVARAAAITQALAQKTRRRP